MSNYYKRGQHNMIDDITGFKHKSGDMRELQGEQKGLFTHYRDWEPENPQLNIRARKDNQTVSNSRPRQETNFITTAITADDL